MARHSRVAGSKMSSKRVRKAARSDKDTIEQLRQELDERREQQAATTDVLKLISRSTFDLQTVLDTLVETATRLCHAKRGLLFRRDGDLYKGAAYFGYSAEFRAFHETHPIAPGRGTTVGRVAIEGRTIHIPDVLADPEYTFLEAQKLGQVRANLGVPLVRGGKPIGALSLARLEPTPFTARQIELVETFAAQAVIAIENARLLNELRQRTDDLSEALEQQTATSEVLKVISSSTGELQPVFQAMLENATRLCTAKFGLLYLCKGDTFCMMAQLGADPAYLKHLPHGPFQPRPETLLAQVKRTEQVVQIEDLANTKGYAQKVPVMVAAVELGGVRTFLGVPMIKDGALAGAILLYRQEIRLFTDKQIELVKNFAAQAVIAIENTRLLSELRESLQQQTATADVLKVISRSTFDLQAVLDTLVESAARLCEADMASINREKDAAFQQIASYGYSSEFQAFMRDHSIPAGRGSVVGRTVMQGKMIHISDVLAAPVYEMTERAEIDGIRTMLGVPLLREGAPIGVIALQRKIGRA